MFRSVALRRTLYLLGAAVLTALVYLYCFPRSQEAPEQTPLHRLSVLIDSHIEAIFSPLTDEVPPIPHQELRMLRESFADSAAKVGPQEQPMYATAIQLCDSLLRAIQERERASVSLADTRSKAYGVALSASRKREEENKRGFFEFSIVRRWSDNSKAYRQEAVDLYQRLRSEERTRDTNSGQPNLATVDSDHIVLHHPTPVQLKYGSATLPAGLSLRVVSRTSDAVVVDYAGENITLSIH